MLNTTVKELLKSVFVCQRYCKNKSSRFYGPPCSNTSLQWIPTVV